MGRGPPLHSPVYSRREPTAREWAKLADEKVAACKAAKEDFDASLKQLRFKLLGEKLIGRVCTGSGNRPNALIARSPSTTRSRSKRSRRLVGSPLCESMVRN